MLGFSGGFVAEFVGFKAYRGACSIGSAERDRRTVPEKWDRPEKQAHAYDVHRWQKSSSHGGDSLIREGL